MPFIFLLSQGYAGTYRKRKKLLPQLHSRHTFQYGQASYGLKQMAWGYFKKLVLADSLSVYVNQVYNDLPPIKAFRLFLPHFLCHTALL